MIMLAKENGICFILCSILPFYEYPSRKEIVDSGGKIADMNESKTTQQKINTSISTITQ